MIKPILLLLAAGLFTNLAAAQMTTFSTPQGNILVPSPINGVPMHVFGGIVQVAQQGTCVLPDSSRTSGLISFLSDKDAGIEVDTDGQKRRYSPDQLAYFTIGESRFVPATVLKSQGKKHEVKSDTVFAAVLATGKLEALRYGYTTFVGNVPVSILLLRRQGATTWAQLTENIGQFPNMKRLREVVGPLVADQPAYAAALADGRITYQNLLQFINSYNAFVAKQP